VISLELNVFKHTRRVHRRSVPSGDTRFHLAFCTRLSTPSPSRTKPPAGDWTQYEWEKIAFSSIQARRLCNTPGYWGKTLLSLPEEVWGGGKHVNVWAPCRVDKWFASIEWVVSKQMATEWFYFIRQAFTKDRKMSILITDVALHPVQTVTPSFSDYARMYLDRNSYTLTRT